MFLPGNVRFLAGKHRFSLRETYGSEKGNVKMKHQLSEDAGSFLSKKSSVQLSIHSI